VKLSPEQANGDRPRPAYDRAQQRLPAAAGTVCPRCGARVGKPCVATVPYLGVGSIGMPIEGVHAERVAEAREQGAT
jgi:hypothetical protein